MATRAQSDTKVLTSQPHRSPAATLSRASCGRSWAIRALTGISISKADFEKTLTDLYTIKGWNPITTIPTLDRLRMLEIEWVADLLKHSWAKKE